MKFNVQILAGLTAACLSSCLATTSYVKRLPPEIRLPEGYNRVMVISAYDTTALDFNQRKKREVFASGSLILLKSIADGLNERTNIYTTLSDSLLFGATHARDPDFTDIGVRRALCKDVGVPLLIVLEAYDLGFRQDVEVVKNEDNTKSRTAYYNLYARAAIYLYDSVGNSLNRSTLSWVYDNYDNRSVISGLLAVGPSLGKAGREINLLSRELGNNFVDKFFPGELMVTKYIYDDKKLKKSTDKMVLNDWNAAISQLSPLTANSDKKTAGRAAYNLAIAYEALGDIASARYWYSEAGDKLQGKKLPDVIDQN